MHILNRRRFFCVVLGWMIMNISMIESTSTYAKIPLESNEPLPIDQGFKPSTELSTEPSYDDEEGRIVEAMQVAGYPVETVVATGYTAGIESTGKDPSHVAYGITYAGVPVRRDMYSTIAADLSTYPLGTILYVPGYGYGVVTDIGSAIQGNKIDLYYETVEDVYNEWGKQTVDVYVVRMGNGTITEEEFNQLNEQELAEVFKQE